VCRNNNDIAVSSIDLCSSCVAAWTGDSVKLYVRASDHFEAVLHQMQDALLIKVHVC